MNLAPEVQEALLNNRISERHARSLLTVDDNLRQLNLLNRIIAERLTVRQLDDLIKSNDSFGVETNLSNSNIVSEPVIDSDANSIKINDNLEVKNAFEFNLNDNNISDINFFDNEKQNESLQTSSELVVETNSQMNDQLQNDSNLLELDNIETFDILDDEKDNVNVDNDKENVEEKTTKGNILDLFKAPMINSLEDEAMNFNIESESLNDDYFNPFTTDEELEENDTKVEPINLKEPVVEVSENVVKKGDLSSVKDAYEKLKKDIENVGFKIVTEDFDFEDIYQIIIKIDKQN